MSLLKPPHHFVHAPEPHQITHYFKEPSVKLNTNSSSSSSMEFDNAKQQKELKAVQTTLEEHQFLAVYIDAIEADFKKPTFSFPYAYCVNKENYNIAAFVRLQQIYSIEHQTSFKTWKFNDNHCIYMLVLTEDGSN
jgi:hypothetical protein